MKKQLIILTAAALSLTLPAVPAPRPAFAVQAAEAAEPSIEDLNAQRETIRALHSTLTDYLRENRLYAVISSEPDEEAEDLITLTFWLTPAEAETFDREAAQAGVRDACAQNSLDPALVKIIFETETADAADSEALWAIRETAEAYIAEKGYDAGVSFGHEVIEPGTVVRLLFSYPQPPADDPHRNDRIAAEIRELLAEKGLADVMPTGAFYMDDYSASAESAEPETTTTVTETSAAETETAASTETASGESTTSEESAVTTVTTTTAAVTTTTAAATTAAGTTTAAPPKTGDRADSGILPAACAALLAAAAAFRRREESA